MHWAVTDVPLTRADNIKIKNLGLKTVYSNLIVKHIKREDNTELSPTTTSKDAKVDTLYDLSCNGYLL